jgi:hypothetical protein
MARYAPEVDDKHYNMLDRKNKKWELKNLSKILKA